ncbi:MAG: HdeD family acid-resistance protein [Candidatus Aquilonibacter sp.]
MVQALANKWWAFLIRGIAGVIFGILALVYPGSALIALTIIFGAYAFVDGIFALAAAFTGVAGSRWWALLLEGILGLVVAFYVWTQPLYSTVALVYAVAIWAVITGIIEIVAGFQLRDAIKNEWLYILAGVVSIIFGILVFRDVDAGAVAIAWTIGIYAILFGIMQLGLAFRLNSVRKAATT